jgi:hypothetical protein
MDKLITDILHNFQSEDDTFDNVESIIREYLQTIISAEDLDNQVQKIMIIIMNEYNDYTDNGFLNKIDFKSKIIDFINEYKIFKYITVDISHKSEGDFLRENNISASDYVRLFKQIKNNMISKWLESLNNPIKYDINDLADINKSLMSTEKKRLLNGSGNPTKSQLDEFLSADKFIKSGDIEAYFQIYDKFGEIWKYLLKKYQKEYNNFTPSLVQEFSSMYPVISEIYIEIMLERYEIVVYPDPIINENGESVDFEGNVLPNCPICSNILNVNMPSGHEYRMIRLLCGGLFHFKCLINDHNNCPICGQEAL